EEANCCLSRRIEQVPRGESVASAFRSWMGDGFPVQRGDIFHTVNRLRRLKSTRRALEVMEWVLRERPYKPSEQDYSNLLEFTIKLHGIERGEALFCGVPSEFRNGSLYNNLVMGCLDKSLIRLSLAYMKKMRELGHAISHLVFNRLIVLHSSPRRRGAIPKLLAQMRADGVTPHVSTYNILLKMEADDHNVEGLARVFRDMKAEPNEITYCIMATAHSVARLHAACSEYTESVERCMTGDNWSTLDILLTLYGSMRKTEEVERTWSRIRQLPHVRAKSFVLAVEAFGKVGNVDLAEEAWEEAAGLRSIDHFNAMIGAYCRNGMITRATSLYKEMEGNGCRPNAITFRQLALGCMKAGLAKEGLKTLSLGAKFPTAKKVAGSTPWLETTHSIAEALAEKGDVENVEKLFEEMSGRKYTRYPFVYNTLIKAYAKAKTYRPNLLRRMILGGSRPDPETYSLIKVIEQFRP
ncbi:hypothetical protein M569_02669, partial [Genlisea aurea]